MRENFFRVLVIEDIFCINGRRITCAGGVATFDMILHLIENLADRQLALEISEALIYSRTRSGNEPARNLLK